MSAIPPHIREAMRLIKEGRAQEGAALLATHAKRVGAAMPALRPNGPPVAWSDAFIARTGDGEREIKLHVPPKSSMGAAPLLLMLHGCTQDPDDFARGTRMNALADAHGFIVAYPAQPQTANPNRCWNWFDATHQRRGAGEPGILAAAIDAIAARHRIDQGRVFVAGLSAGGAMAANLAALYPEKIAAIGVHSGLAVGAAAAMPGAFKAMREGAPGRAWTSVHPPARAILIHGDADTTVAPVNAEHLARQFSPAFAVEQLVRGETGGQAYTRIRACDVEGRVRLERWILHGAGHAWSGGDPAGSHTHAGGIDASATMVRFFLEP